MRRVCRAARSFQDVGAYGTKARYVQRLPARFANIANVYGLSDTELGLQANRIPVTLETIAGRSCMIGTVGGLEPWKRRSCRSNSTTDSARAGVTDRRTDLRNAVMLQRDSRLPGVPRGRAAADGTIMLGIAVAAVVVTRRRNSAGLQAC